MASTEMIPARLHPWLNDLETLYNPWLLSGVVGIGLNHSIYARCVGTCAAREDWGDGNICDITEVGI